jgi:hypothetical protein
MFGLAVHRFDPVPAILISATFLLSVAMIWAY